MRGPSRGILRLASIFVVLRGDQWLVTTSVLGQVTCQHKPRGDNCRWGYINIIQHTSFTLIMFRTPVILESGSVSCLETAPELESSWRVYTRAGCGGGEVLLPASWERDTRPCPHTFLCSTHYSQERRWLQNPDNSLLRREAKRFIRDMICDTEPR